jgi:hypothetical protein
MPAAAQSGFRMLYIIDGTAPFFAAARFSKNETINWSKVPFSHLESDGGVRPDVFDTLPRDFERYIRNVSHLGYNAVTIDDVAHLVAFDFYPPWLQKKIESYQHLYERLFHIACNYGITIFLTSDILFFNEYIEKYTRNKPHLIVHLLAKSLRRLFKKHECIHGIVFRLGECDGIDVQGDFCSKIILKTAKQGRRLIMSLLPTFEKYGRMMILRTWTLGAYSIGDLMWNTNTQKTLLHGITSDNIIISLKYGDTDFFRYVKFDPDFGGLSCNKIIELQTRREYEGFGEFPSFIGSDYQRIARCIRTETNILGIMVWCQTGGWSHFRRLSFLSSDALWSEINTFVTIKIFKDNMSAAEAVNEYSLLHFPDKNPSNLVHLMSLSERVMRKLWYIPDFSEHTLYFRRIRVVPLLWIFWDTICINHPLRKMLRPFVPDRKECIRDGYRMLLEAKKMIDICVLIGIDPADCQFQYDTLRVLAYAREYFLGKGRSIPEIKSRLITHIHEYRCAYPDGFAIEYDFSPMRVKKNIMKALFKICLRHTSSYRMIDRLVIIRLTGWIYPLTKLWQNRRLPDFTRQRAMGIDVFFK